MVTQRALPNSEVPPADPGPPELTTLECLLRRVVGEFRDMPGLKLTPTQAARLFGMDLPLCERLFMALVERQHLRRGPDGRYGRASVV